MLFTSFTTLRRNTWLTDMFYLGIVLAVFYFIWLGSYPLFIPDEGRYSEVAREMVATGDYITPRVNGVVFLDKPILYYWLQAIAIHLFGLKEWSLRFFPALSGILGTLMTYFCGRYLYDRRTGLLAAIVLATTPLYFACAHYANLDLEVAVWMSGALLFFITAMQTPSPSTRRYFLLSAYGFAGLAFLTKGLIGIALPGLIGLIWIGVTKRFHELKRLHLLLGISLFALIVTPWYVLAQKANPEFLHFFFITQQVMRFLSSAEFNNPSPVWFYAPIVLLGFLPWTGFLIQSIKNALSSSNHTTRYLLIWMLVVFTFFSIPRSKTVSYILPIFPAIALLVGHWLSQSFQSTKRWMMLAAASSAVFLLSLSYYADHFNQDTTKPLITQLMPLLQPQDEVIHYYKFYQDVPLYLERRVTLVANWHAPDIEKRDNWVRELWYGMPFQDTRDWLIDETEFWQRFNGPQRLFVFLNDNYFEQFKSHALHYYIIDTYNDVILLSNKPTLLSSL